MYSANTNVILNIPNNINKRNEKTKFTSFLNSHHLLLGSFFANQKQSVKYFDDNNMTQSTDSHFLASSIGIFGLCRALLVLVLLPPKNEFNEYGGRTGRR